MEPKKIPKKSSIKKTRFEDDDRTETETIITEQTEQTEMTDVNENIDGEEIYENHTENDNSNNIENGEPMLEENAETFTIDDNRNEINNEEWNEIRNSIMKRNMLEQQQQEEESPELPIESDEMQLNIKKDNFRRQINLERIKIMNKIKKRIKIGKNKNNKSSK